MEKSNGSNDAAPKIICDGEIEIIKITEDYVEKAVELFVENFPKHENFCIGTDLPANELAVKELEGLCRETLKDGFSFAAKHIETGRLASVCINSILEPHSEASIGEYLSNTKSPELLYIGELIDRIENTVNIYEKYNINCNMEVVFLSTRPEFERKGIARSLTLYAMEHARDFGNGLLPDEDFPKHVQGKRPKGVTSVFSAKFTQIIGHKLGFETVTSIKFEDLEYKGVKLSDKVDPIHECITYAFKML